MGSTQNGPQDASPFNLCPDIALNLQRLPFRGRGYRAMKGGVDDFKAENIAHIHYIPAESCRK